MCCVQNNMTVSYSSFQNLDVLYSTLLYKPNSYQAYSSRCLICLFLIDFIFLKNISEKKREIHFGSQFAAFRALIVETVMEQIVRLIVQKRQEKQISEKKRIIKRLKKKEEKNNHMKRFLKSTLLLQLLSFGVKSHIKNSSLQCQCYSTPHLLNYCYF